MQKAKITLIMIIALAGIMTGLFSTAIADSTLKTERHMIKAIKPGSIITQERTFTRSETTLFSDLNGEAVIINKIQFPVYALISYECSDGNCKNAVSVVFQIEFGKKPIPE
ncbi:MAG: hypothetical protein KKE44_07535 [Proteobacteria bacterium]|nr:hypothetical protein [Pseudomonadota bacterium]MBU1582581.1 hypothetical protein [Pseudomonadota bacterium]MBU2452252.1 hypothetical protein [Pseudomonadota bacterium]MBU2630214.1 hypothetical protein [Pseudomonadota bacterium]